ncbi:hypothetical protein [Providencia rettgeri]|uniref:hypothetical protein n=1 Tax=Providencia TaxID=586 RepID=UPI0024B9DDFA|nr:hypothetical protein [Providencia rettgeri]WHT81904.1 hypothetical protein KOL65_21960 [Providencia rettgeri]
MKKPKNTLSVRLSEPTIDIVDSATTVFFHRADVLIAAMLNFDALSIDERNAFLSVLASPPKKPITFRLPEAFFELIDGYTNTIITRPDVIHAALLAFDNLDVDKRYQYLNEAKVKNNE